MNTGAVGKLGRVRAAPQAVKGTTTYQVVTCHLTSSHSIIIAHLCPCCCVPNPPKTSQQGVEVVLAAMAPCARLYAYLACQLALQHPQWRASPYARWVESYSGSEYLVGLSC